jgi:hypothetical protein
MPRKYNQNAKGSMMEMYKAIILQYATTYYTVSLGYVPPQK